MTLRVSSQQIFLLINPTKFNIRNQGINFYCCILQTWKVLRANKKNNKVRRLGAHEERKKRDKENKINKIQL
jgi:hypothetical protein